MAAEPVQIKDTLTRRDDGRRDGSSRMFAVFDSEGNLRSPDVTILSIIWDMPISVMSPQKIRGPDGRWYTIAVYPMLQRNLFVLAAVSWDKLLGPMVTLTTVWPFIMGILGLIGILSVYIMWQKVIMPLKDLEEGGLYA